MRTTGNVGQCRMRSTSKTHQFTWIEALVVTLATQSQKSTAMPIDTVGKASNRMNKQRTICNAFLIPASACEYMCAIYNFRWFTIPSFSNSALLWLDPQDILPKPLVDDRVR